MEMEKITGSPLIQGSKTDIQMNSAVDQSKVQPRDKKVSNVVINPKEVETVVSKMNEFVEPLRTNLKFVLHDELGEYYVTVVNPHTNEIVREIPPKKMLDMYAAMAELMGLFIDQKI